MTIFFLKLSSSWQALQNNFLPVTVKHSLGNSLTLSRGLTVFGSLAPLPRDLRCPIGGGLQTTLRFRVNSESLGALNVSKIDNSRTCSLSTGLPEELELGASPLSAVMAVTVHCPCHVAKVLTGNEMLPIDPFFILVTCCTATNLRSDIY